MALADDDVVQLLAKLPAIQEAPEAARNEAAVVVKRGQAAEKSDDRAALQSFVEALELDPACKGAYEGIGRLVLSSRSLGRPAVEAAVRFIDAAKSRVPNDPSMLDLGKKIRGLLSEGAAIEPALAKATAKLAPKPATPRAAGSTRKCEYCGSPIPAGASSCRSCQMSGEIHRPDLEAMKATADKQKSSKVVLILLFVTAIFAVGALAMAAYVRLHR